MSGDLFKKAIGDLIGGVLLIGVLLGFAVAAAVCIAIWMLH